MKVFTLLAVGALLLLSCQNNEAGDDSGNISTQRRLEGEELVKRGEYLTTIGGCHDCHSPKKFNPMGFTFDSSRLLSGHPADAPKPPVDNRALQPGYWVLMAPDLTSFVGPWGMSYAANLTPDSTTGLGGWTEENFRQALRKGKHMGMDNGRPIMPPMPWEVIGRMTDEDISAVFAYLRSIPPVNNKVPPPVPPDQVQAGGTPAGGNPQAGAAPPSQP